MRERDDLSLGSTLDHLHVYECDKCHVTQCDNRKVLEDAGWVVHHIKHDPRVITLCASCEPPKRTTWFNYKPTAP